MGDSDSDSDSNDRVKLGFNPKNSTPMSVKKSDSNDRSSDSSSGSSSGSSSDSSDSSDSDTSISDDQMTKSDEFIKQLINEIQTSGTNNNKKMVLRESKLRILCKRAKIHFLTQSSLLEIDGPVNVVGDIHAQYSDLLRIFRFIGHPKDQRYMFLGDYVDRGNQGIEVMSLLFALSIKYPESIYLLRGNHENEDMNRKYGFYNDVLKKYSKKLYYSFLDAFHALPIAGLIGTEIFCLHGGISPDLKSLQDIRNIQRPIPIPRQGLLCDLVWSDPHPGISGFRKNRSRGTAYEFGPDVFENFRKRTKISLLIRAHQVAEEGYKFVFKKNLLNIFSAPNYMKGLNNPACVIAISKELLVTFNILHVPKNKK